MAGTRTADQACLPVHTRLTLSRGGTEVDRLVSCRARGGAVSTDVCAGCDHATEVSVAAGVVRCLESADASAGTRASDLRRALATTRVAQAMGPESWCVRPDVALVEIMALFAEGAGTVPVVDGEQRLAGIVALETALQARGDPQVTAGDLAIPPSAVLFDTTVLEEAVMALAASPEGALPVVSRTGGVLGVLRSVDFTRWTAARLT